MNGSLLLLVLLGLPTTAAHAQIARPDVAALEVVGINVAVNLFDRLFHAEPAQFRVSPATWWDNVQHSWEWDDNNFSTNQFAHPYHGSTYYNAARSNGLDYWESAPFAALGSLMWEYMGEVNPPALNDFFATTLGGIALGEMFHRTAVLIRDNEATGSERLWRELAALPVDPVGSLNRFFKGEMNDIGPNPDERRPGALSTRLSAGYHRFTGDVLLGDNHDGVFLELTLDYGNLFSDRTLQPFDMFRLQVEASSRDSGFISRLQGEGALVRFPLKAENHRLFLTQRFDFISNSAFRVGGQSVEGRVVSRFPLTDQLRLTTTAGLLGILLGAVNSEFVGPSDRDYDFGPGIGLQLNGVLTSSGGLAVNVAYLANLLFTLAGDQGTHYIQAAGLNLLVPVRNGLGLGARAGYFRRDSWYPDDVARHQDSPELRAFVWWNLQ